MSPTMQYKPEPRWRRFVKALGDVDFMDVMLWSVTLLIAAVCIALAVQVIRWGVS